jgi:hypothetical protein
MLWRAGSSSGRTCRYDRAQLMRMSLGGRPPTPRERKAILRHQAHAAFTLLLIACGARSGPTSAGAGPQSEAVCLEPVAEGCELHQVPLLELLAQPERWRGRRVAVEGYLHLEPEGSALYLSAEDYQRRNFRRALLTTSTLRDVLGPACRCNDQEVLLIGMYDPSDRGHTGAWGGAVKDIEHVTPREN